MLLFDVWGSLEVVDRGFISLYIYIIYTPNLGFEIAVLGEQGRFKGSIKGNLLSHLHFDFHFVTPTTTLL